MDLSTGAICWRTVGDTREPVILVRKESVDLWWAVSLDNDVPYPSRLARADVTKPMAPLEQLAYADRVDDILEELKSSTNARARSFYANLRER